MAGIYSELLVDYNFRQRLQRGRGGLWQRGLQLWQGHHGQRPSVQGRLRNYNRELVVLR